MHWRPVRSALALSLGCAALAPWVAAPVAWAQGRTYYVRPDGGSADRCTGLVDAPAPGSGTAQPCAWDHPFRALPPGGPPRIAGGDTLIIAAGSYMMGYGAPGAETCDAGGSFGCVMVAVPSGPDPARPTRILGAGWETGTSAPPELWGTERAAIVLNLARASNVMVAHLEITDHSSCVEFHSGGLACQRDTSPYGPWAAVGVYAEDSANVYLLRLNVHGLAATGIWAGRLRDWTVEDVRIAGNGSVGWDGDIPGEDSNSGTLTFRRWTVEWNGCGETYPGGQPAGCWAQSAGGYGDGVGTGETGGRWVIEDSVFRYNTSDGLDLLYARLPDSSIEIRRTIAVGNAGNQIKTTGPALVENSIIVGNCGFFNGQPFTHNVDDCRALGTALFLVLRPGNQVSVTNNTIASEGDCLATAECNGTCTGAERVRLRNNIFRGHIDYLQPFEQSCLVYQETFPVDPFDVDYSLITGVKEDACPGPHDICGVSPGLVNDGIDTFDGHLLPGSPAIGAALSSSAPITDFDGRLRDAAPDIGAYERGSTSPTATLTVTQAGTGGGIVTSNPVGITCGVDCTGVYARGTVVTLAALPAAGSALAGWSGCTSVSAVFCTVTMDADRTVIATFSAGAEPPPPPPPGQPALTVGVDGTLYRTGQTMTVTGTLTAGSTPRLVDAYVVVQLPDGGFLSLQLGGRVVPGIVPIAQGLTPFAFNGELLRYAFSGVEPSGTYTWMSALSDPGTLNVIGSIDQHPFTFGP